MHAAVARHHANLRQGTAAFSGRYAALHKTVARLTRNCLCWRGYRAQDDGLRWRSSTAPSGLGSSELSAWPTKSEGPVTIKKYANRRLYNTGTSTYVTLEDLATMVKNGEDFAVFDAKTGEDITRSVLAQIIFEQENKEGGQNLLPINFLRQLIRFYGDSMQKLVPSYLEVSLDSLTREQEKFRQQIHAGVRRDAVRSAARGPGPPQHGNVQAGVLDVHAVRAARGGRGRRRRGREAGGFDPERSRRAQASARRHAHARSSKLSEGDK